MNLGYGSSTEVNDEVTTVVVAGHQQKYKTDFMSVADGWKHHATIEESRQCQFHLLFP
jgi:hypothetical protein